MNNSQTSSAGAFDGKRVAVVLFSNFPGDPRPRRAAEALQAEGASVDVICLKYSEDELRSEDFNGIAVTRIPLNRRRGGKLGYLWQYGAFFCCATFLLTFRTLRRRYHLVHVHNMPDFLVFSALPARLRGAKVILDLHDPMPELMMTIFGLREESASVSLLKRVERWSLRFASAVVTVNEACRRIFSRRSCPAEKITVIMNSPDEAIFSCRPPAREKGAERPPEKPFAIMYHGSIVERHGLDLAVRAFEKVHRDVPGAELHIYGRSTPFLEEVMESVQRSSAAGAIRYFGPKSVEEISAAIRESDLGVIPNRRSIFTELNTPTRIFEYLSQGIPVIAPRAPGILDYFQESELLLFELGDPDDLAERIRFAASHPAETAAIAQRGQEVYRSHIWKQERLRFLELVNRLLSPDTAMKRIPARAALAGDAGDRRHQ